MIGQTWGDAETRELLERARRRALPPSAGARARVWSRIERKRVRPRRRFAWAAFALGAVTASVLAFLVARARSRDGEAALLTVDATRHDASAPRSWRPGEPLPAASGRDPLQLVELPGAGRLVAGPGTRARLERLDAAGVTLRLDEGSLLLHVLPRPKDAPFVVHTPRFTARVVGTVLRVVVRPDGAASLAVGHGVVEVTPTDGAPVRVQAGERWPAGSLEAPLPGELERLGPLDLEGTTAADLAAPRDQSVPPSAASAEASHASLGSESVLYQAGFRALTEQKDARAALDIWEEERGRFPHGVLAPDVDASIIDALVALGHTHRALAEIDAYLRAWPDSLKASELHFVRGMILRRLDGNCRRARAELRRALEHPAGSWAARARLACR